MWTRQEWAARPVVRIGGDSGHSVDAPPRCYMSDQPPARRHRPANVFSDRTQRNRPAIGSRRCRGRSGSWHRPSPLAVESRDGADRGSAAMLHQTRREGDEGRRYNFRLDFFTPRRSGMASQKGPIRVVHFAPSARPARQVAARKIQDRGAVDIDPAKGTRSRRGGRRRPAAQDQDFGRCEEDD